MIPGPDQIIACPKCKGLARYGTLISGNTCEARVWTDGKWIAPMLPLPPAVVKCRHCGECYWLADGREVGEVGKVRRLLVNLRQRLVNRDCDYVKEPAEEDYYAALNKGLAADEEQEKALRILAWWRRNDAFRDGTYEQKMVAPDPSGLWKENLEALLRMLDECNEEDCLLKTEVLRQLGQFDSARQALSRVVSPQLGPVVARFRSLLDKGDTQVRELHLREQPTD